MSGSMPSDAELEADAERERDRSRREAERILTREAEERRRVEERVLAMMGSTRGLPPPPSRSQTMSNPPSPSNSQKEAQSWWTAAKNRLTPTKDLTPAQQVIQDAKTKDKKGKGKERDELKFSDPVSLVPPPHRKPVPASPSSPTPSRPSLSNMPPNLTPSPMRSVDGMSSSPSREAPPLYAQFNAQGTLDVPGTLLIIVKRFEKLEKWTVGHVRALEERMSDVERWLVDKEKEKEKASPAGGDPVLVQDIKDGMTELQGRVTELGREMARLATSPSNLSSGPTSRQPGPPSVAPLASSTILSHDEPLSLSPITPSVHSRFSTTARESTSPPLSSARSASGTKLPYPAGDYGTPSDAGVVSPSHSPPSSITRGTRGVVGLGISTSSGSSSAVFTSSPPPASVQRTLPPPPKTGPVRPTSVSPTPRKRYTVALGEPIVSPPDFGEPLSTSVGTAFFSTWDGGVKRGVESDRDRERERGERTKRDGDGNVEKDKGEEFEDETIGKRASRRFTAGMTTASASPSPASKRRIRAQSTYAGFASLQLPDSESGPAPQTTITPLRPKIRSKSSEKLGGGGGEQGTGVFGGGGRFVDPLVLRRQEKEGTKGPVALPKPLGKKVPVGQLVAFFDGEKRV